MIVPDPSEGNHPSYAAQWFIFSIAAAVGWLLTVRRSVRIRRRTPPEPADDHETEAGDAAADGPPLDEYQVGN